MDDALLYYDLTERVEIEHTAALIFSDYGKGVLTEAVKRIDWCDPMRGAGHCRSKGDDQSAIGGDGRDAESLEPSPATRMFVETTEEITAAAEHLLSIFNLTSAWSPVR